MKKLIILFLLICSPSVGICEEVATYSGQIYTGCSSVGDTNKFLTNPNDYATVKPGYVYLPNGCKSLPQVASKYLYQDQGQIKERTQAEKTAIDQAEQAQALAQSKAEFNARIEVLKAQVDNPTDPSLLLNTCISGITTEEIRGMKSGNPKPSKTDQQLRDTVKACLEAYKK